MGRAPCCDKVGLKKGPWTPEEDQILINFIQNHGHSNWRALPKQSGLLRCGKSCRLRWINYLRPDIKRGNFTREEEDTIIHLHEVMGNRWSAIAARLPGRTDNEIKNVWHTHLKKRLKEYQTTKSESKNARKSRDNNKKNVVTTTIDSTTSAISDNNHRVTSSNNNGSGSRSRSGSSPQQSSTTTSDEFSSGTEVSSIELPVHINAISFDDSMIQDDFPLIDETFWEPLEDHLYNMPSTSEEFSEFIINDNDDSGLRFETLLNDDQENAYHNNNDNNNNNIDQNGPGIFFGDDNMDFWLDVFVQAGGAPELPEF